MTFVPWRHLATLCGLRERDLFTFGYTLLWIAMSHPLFGLRVSTLTINSDDVGGNDVGGVKGYDVGGSSAYNYFDTYRWFIHCLTCVRTRNIKSNMSGSVMTRGNDSSLSGIIVNTCTVNSNNVGVIDLGKVWNYDVRRVKNYDVGEFEGNELSNRK